MLTIMGRRSTVTAGKDDNQDAPGDKVRFQRACAAMEQPTEKEETKRKGKIDRNGFWLHQRHGVFFRSTLKIVCINRQSG